MLNVKSGKVEKWKSEKLQGSVTNIINVNYVGLLLRNIQESFELIKLSIIFAAEMSCFLTSTELYCGLESNSFSDESFYRVCFGYY